LPCAPVDQRSRLFEGTRIEGAPPVIFDHWCGPRGRFPLAPAHQTVIFYSSPYFFPGVPQSLHDCKTWTKSSVTERAVTGQNLFNNGRLGCRSPFGKALARQAKANLHPLAFTLVPCSCVQVRYGVAVLHEHRLRGLRSPRLAATEPTNPQGALGAPLTATFALVLIEAFGWTKSSPHHSSEAT
jgi:hypothetical protein